MSRSCYYQYTCTLFDCSHLTHKTGKERKQKSWGENNNNTKSYGAFLIMLGLWLPTYMWKLWFGFTCTDAGSLYDTSLPTADRWWSREWRLWRWQHFTPSFFLQCSSIRQLWNQWYLRTFLARLRFLGGGSPNTALLSTPSLGTEVTWKKKIPRQKTGGFMWVRAFFFCVPEDKRAPFNLEPSSYKAWSHPGLSFPSACHENI